MFRNTDTPLRIPTRFTPAAFAMLDGDGDGGGGSGGEGGEGSEDKPKEGDAPKSISQEEMSRIAAREKREGKQAGRKEFLKELGLEEDDLKAVLASHRENAEKDKTEAQKAREAADKEKSEAQAEKAAAKKEIFTARATTALVSAGCPADDAEDVAALIKLNPEDDPDKDDISEAVKALKTKMPQLFGGAKQEEGGNPGSDPGTGSRQGGNGQKSASEQAKDLLASRHPKQS